MTDTSPSPARAAYEAWQATRTGIPDADDWHWDILGENAQAAWVAAAQAAVSAAQMPIADALRDEVTELRTVITEMCEHFAQFGTSREDRLIAGWRKRAGLATPS